MAKTNEVLRPLPPKCLEWLQKYKELFAPDKPDLDEVTISIRRLLLDKDHPLCIPFEGTVIKKTNKISCFLKAEKEEIKQLIAQGEIDKIKEIINVFNGFNIEGISKIELGILYESVAHVKENLPCNIRSSLCQATRELFLEIVEKHSDLENLYNNVLSLLGENPEL